MNKIMNIISSETHGKSFKTFKYCFDGIEVPTLSYDDHKDITWEDYGETEVITQAKNLKTFADLLKNEQPLFKFFLDGSRRAFKVDDISYNQQVFPVIAGQIGVGCCSRNNKFLKTEDFIKKNIIVLPDIANQDDWNKEVFWGNLCKKINDNIPNKKISISNIKSYKYIKNETENLENKGIAVIQDFMIENEILMVNKLVKTNKINYDNYLLKDGSLEYRVDNIKDPRKLRFFANTFNYVVGASKSFNPENCRDKRGKNNSNMIADLPLYSRIPVNLYTSTRLKGMRYAVWYVRIRDKKYTTNAFDGILKLEKILVLNDSNEHQILDTEEVDLITANIINERNPVCYGSDFRWANHLYPIYITEKFIKSKYLSNNMFLNLF